MKIVLQEWNVYMKVLHICNNYLNSKLYKSLFEALEKLDVENIVYVPLNKSIVNKEENNIILSNISTNNIDRLIYFTKQEKIYNDIKEKVDLGEIDFVHAHTLFSAGYAAYRLNKAYNIPYITAVRNTDVNTFFKYMKHLKFLGKNVLNNSNKAVFLSPVYKEKVVNKILNGDEEIWNNSIVIPNGIDRFFLDNIKYKNAFNKENINIIYVGQIDKNKNIVTTIKAVCKLREMGYNINFAIVGEIKHKRYNELISKHNFVKYFPKCSKEDVLMQMNQADIFVMPSHTETFGLVYAEAMTQGLPVIYTKGEGFDKQFEEGCVGYSVNSKNYIDVAEKIEMVINNYNYLSKNCTESSSKFDWDIIAKEYKKIYLEK